MTYEGFSGLLPWVEGDEPCFEIPKVSTLVRMAAVFSDFFKTELNLGLFVGSLGGPNGLTGKDFLESELCGALPRFKTEGDFVSWSASCLELVPINHDKQTYVLGTVCYPDEDFLMLSRNQDNCQVGLVGSKGRVAIFVPHDKPTVDNPLDAIAAYKVYCNFCKYIWHLNEPVAASKVTSSPSASQKGQPIRKSAPVPGNKQGMLGTGAISSPTPAFSPVSEEDLSHVVDGDKKAGTFQGNEPISLSTRDDDPRAPSEGTIAETTSLSPLESPSSGQGKSVRERKRREPVMPAVNHEPTGSWLGQRVPAETDILRTSLFSKSIPTSFDTVKENEAFKKQDDSLSIGLSVESSKSADVKRNNRTRPSSKRGNPSNF